MNGAHVDPDAAVAEGVSIAPGAVVYAGARIGAGSHLGAGVVVHPGTEIGEEAFVAAGALVTRDVGTREVVMGVPSRVVRRVSDEDLLERWR